ncbi:MAG: MutL protein [Clostridiaceae bacterium]|jgi:uncharacterized protein (TIGR01319 family)|nr:methylaspartate mutase accessory protein GlmL [Eubacteriales bacterium]MDD4461896.1 methylaspartate mutase accessory protein GlmL [Eubacteriales bacterium]NLV47808.1 MutL protein [Clostridiaceae bacterium]
MNAVLLTDFGSTFTKVTAVDVDTCSLLGTAAAFTTAETDIGEGLSHALAKLEQQTGRIPYNRRLACSSAAGGLRMVTVGLVPELTAEAARLASLGAGAKVVRVFSFHLTTEDIQAISSSKPDILLLTGGIDGGDTACMLHNAHMLAGCEGRFPILIAGNRSCAHDCQAILNGRETDICPNVLPKLGQLNIEPVQKKIREIFLKRIIHGKGLSAISGLIDGILMPTPSAMLEAMTLLAAGTPTQSGQGDLMAIDLGGATTDVYSLASGSPTLSSTILKGLPEPFAKRTVEGDIGMRYSARSVLEAAGPDRLATLSGLAAGRIDELVSLLADHPDMLPDIPELAALDFALACTAVEIAVTRHTGKLEEAWTPQGPLFVQTGKDLTEVRQLVMTGGAIIHASRSFEIAAHAFYDPARPYSLRPKSARISIDRRYILPAMGLLCQEYPEAALQIMKKELEEHGSC